MGTLRLIPGRKLLTGEFKYFASTVMSGPQIKQAIPITRKIKIDYPEIIIIWGGYFASNQKVCSINSGYIDYIVNGPGDNAFPKLIDAIEADLPTEDIENLVYKMSDRIVITKKSEIPDQDLLKPLPYEVLNQFYPIKNYIGKTYLGSRTFAYHSSMGCPFTCAFCGIVPIFNARWKAKSAKNIYSDVKSLKNYCRKILFH